MDALQRLVGFMDKMVRDRTISANDVLRRGRRKRRKIDIDSGMKRWLAVQTQRFRSTGRIATTNGNKEDENISEKQHEYLRKLFSLVYGKMTGWEADSEMEAEVHEIYEDLTEDGSTMDINNVAIAWELWEEENAAVYRFPDVREVYATMGDGKEQGPVNLAALQGEEVDQVIFMDNEVGETYYWSHQELDLDMPTQDYVPFPKLY